MLTRFDPVQKQFGEMARTFAAKELRSLVEEHDHYPFGEGFGHVLDKAHELGLLAVTLPEKWGGLGESLSTLVTVLDRVSQEDASLAGVIFTSALAQELLLQAWDEEALGQAFRTSEKASEIALACPAFCDPGHAKVLPRAEGPNVEGHLTGRIEFVALGNVATRALLPARTSDHGYAFFLVNLAGKGVTRSEPLLTLGMHACPVVDLVLDGAAAYRVGAADSGALWFKAAAERLHLASAAIATGIMKGSLKEALAYARKRTQGGRELIHWSEVAMILGNMTVKAQAADLCLASACRAAETCSAGWEAASLAASIHIHEQACEVVNDGVQVLGGYGYMKDYGQEKRYRDARHAQALLGLPGLKKLSLVKG